MNAKQKQEKAKIREAVKKQLAAKGIAPKQADELLKQVEDKGWAWNPEPGAEGSGVIFCACGAYAVVGDLKLFRPQDCPNCKRPWKLAEVQ